MKYDIPVEKVKVAAAIHTHNLAVVSVLTYLFLVHRSFRLITVFLTFVFVILCVSRLNLVKNSVIFTGISKGHTILSWRLIN